MNINVMIKSGFKTLSHGIKHLESISYRIFIYGMWLVSASFIDVLIRATDAFPFAPSTIIPTYGEGLEASFMSFIVVIGGTLLSDYAIKKDRAANK